MAKTTCACSPPTRPKLFFAKVRELSHQEGWPSDECFNPDGTSNHFEYSCCGLDWTRDRLNRVTSFTRDALGRTTAVTDPENRRVEFRYNGADQITNLITWVGSQQRRGLCLVLLVVDVGSLFANRPACFTTPDGGPKFTS